MNPFALSSREQQQLFLYDKTYLSAGLLKVGGLSTLLARFIVQFFWNPVIAMTLTFALLMLSAYLLWVAVRDSRKDWRPLVACLIPAGLIGASLSDNSLHFDFLTSILMVEAGLVLYGRISRRKLLWGTVLTGFLYLTAGPAAMLFAVCASILDLLGKEGGKRAYSLIYPAVALVCGAAAFQMAAVPTWAAAFTPCFHYDLDATMPAVHWVSWVAIPVATTLAKASGNPQASSGKRRKVMLSASSAVFLLSIMVSTGINRILKNDASLTIYEYEHYAAGERWDDLIESCRHHAWTPGTANYLNLAMAQKGILVDNLLRYDQKGVSSLLLVPEARTVDVRVAYIMFAMGNIAAAQNVAFNAMTTMNGYSPAMVRMNARIELMRGSYEVADKYLSLLEKSLHYRGWAKEQRRFLWNDAAVEADPLLGNGRRNFPTTDGFAMFGNPVDELERVIEANQSDPKAMEYALSFLLLSKDIERLCCFVDRYWGSPSLQRLPVPVQEALIFYSEYTRNIAGNEPVSLEWCALHGVTRETVARFTAFQQASLQSNGTTPSGFANTYWIYLLSKKI